MEFILKVEDEPFVKNGEKLYKSTAFASLVFDQKGLDKLERYDRAKREAEKYELTKLRGQVDDLCNEVNRLTSLESKSYGIGFNEGYEQGIKQGRKEMCEAVIKLTDDSTRICAFDGENIEHIFRTYKPKTILEELAHFDKQKFDKDLSTLVEQYVYDGVTRVLRKMIESEKE